MLCDRCKRALEKLYAEIRKEKQSPILFDGKYMNGYDCMMSPPENAIGSYFCLQNHIKDLAEHEKPACVV